jgi:hypothetical protein
MYRYNTSLRNSPPVTPQMRALDGLASPYEYPGAHGDVMRSRAAQVSADYNVDADKMNAGYDLSQQQAQNALVLQGLGNLSQDRDNQRKVYQGRLDLMRGMQNNILGGIFG